VHGNLPALEAVLADAADCELIVFGGDVAYGPMPAETLDRLQALGDRARFVRGNADRLLSAWCAARLTSAHREFVHSFEPTVSVDVDGLGPVLFCHGTPRSDEEIVTAITPPERVQPVLTGVAERVVVCGHVHVQYDRTIGERRLVNAGSVGLPYEGRPGAYWLRLGPGIEHRRTEYDLDAAVAAMRATGYPDIEEFLRESLLEPVDPGEVTRYFEDLASA
jgi:diadenosine tetraphosphatase ApaH/serine/threonine PP2A family protein phosphatase